MIDFRFSDLGLSPPLLESVARSGFQVPTQIQCLAIPPQLSGRDVLGTAGTGSGKTLAFGLPILHKLLELGSRPAAGTCRALILVPTRELARQVDEKLRDLVVGSRLRLLLVVGGLPRDPQIRALSRGVDLLIATPGRLADLVQIGALRLDEVRNIAVDEADQMLDLGFVETVQKILASLHPHRQTALFSATMPKEVARFASGILVEPLRVEVDPQQDGAATILELAEVIQPSAKRARLATLLESSEVVRALIFARTRACATELASNLAEDAIVAEVMHGGKTQWERLRALARFRSGLARILVATDLVARGIDVEGISHVINYDLPDSAESYVHRVGRTGRHGASGIAITLCSPRDLAKLRAIERLTRRTLLDPEHAAARAGRPRRSGKNVRRSRSSA